MLLFQWVLSGCFGLTGSRHVKHVYKFVGKGALQRNRGAVALLTADKSGLALIWGRKMHPDTSGIGRLRVSAVTRAAARGPCSSAGG